MLLRLITRSTRVFLIFGALAGLVSCGCSRTERPAAARGARSPALGVAPEQAYEPPLSPGEQRPLLIFLHGFGSSGKVAFDALRFAEFGARERVFVLAPDGTSDSEGRKYWDAGPPCCNFGGPPLDDTARVGDLIDRYLGRGVIDPKRVFVIGYSNGGFLAHRIACQLSTRVAAVASVAGAPPASLAECKLSAPVAVLEVHGDDDETVSYVGGHVMNLKDAPAHIGAKEGFQAWAKLLGCAQELPPASHLDLFSRLPGAETRMVGHEGCTSGSTALLTVRGGDHYLGTEPRLLTEVWRYFQAHPKP